ncbi:hypothetical protein EXIGLDRAFT_718005 [Exidia glandulosa HHB12029]|uniref:NadR/Ttd14 AAA domain-containing protein n=1 Tax=Exidia glandulosa HHB12029 TaxID=1314781 RepID=A0A165I301_EXIGL|nr:hypothetical protein EXIGLDRAFT_718005 [Exidia glandulosa HHB12029]
MSASTTMHPQGDSNADDSSRTITSIYVVGPSSSGKTTLCKALAERLQLPPERFVQEVARNVMKATGFSRSTITNLEMQRTILVAQVQAEREALAAPSDAPILLCDRSAVDALVYAALGFANGVQRQDELIAMPEFKSTLARYRSSLFVLLVPVQAWLVDDGVRQLDRPECLDTFRATLRRFDIEVKELGPDCLDLERRVDAVIRWSRAAQHLQ